MAIKRSDLAKVIPLDKQLREQELQYRTLKKYSMSFAFAVDYPEPPARDEPGRGRQKGHFNIEIHNQDPAYKDMIAILQSVIEKGIQATVAELNDIGVEIYFSEVMIALRETDPALDTQ